MICVGCDKEFTSIYDNLPICNSCVEARMRSVGGKCRCGKKARAGAVRKVFSRRWIPCLRCLGTIKQLS